jgi:hypothetical protein
MFKRKNKNEIVFTNILGLDFYPPKPAIKDVPSWYKDAPEYIGTEGKKIVNGINMHTIKKCMPVFDAMTSGYILYTQVDVEVTQENGQPIYKWPSQNFIGIHPNSQAPNHPLNQELPYPKFGNPYAIKTPKGYSTLFTQPFHRKSIFTILPGIVDTDRYSAQVLFPFVLNDSKWEGIIPAGTPMAQAIPFKRESWISKIGLEEELKEVLKINQKRDTTFFNSYKKHFWEIKDYK